MSEQSSSKTTGSSDLAESFSNEPTADRNMDTSANNEGCSSSPAMDSSQPAKPKVLTTTVECVEYDEPPKRKVGRPPKKRKFESDLEPSDASATADLDSSKGEASGSSQNPPAKRKVGRPPKSVAKVMPTSPMASSGTRPMRSCVVSRALKRAVYGRSVITAPLITQAEMAKLHERKKKLQERARNNLIRKDLTGKTMAEIALAKRTSAQLSSTISHQQANITLTAVESTVPTMAVPSGSVVQAPIILNGKTIGTAPILTTQQLSQLLIDPNQSPGSAGLPVVNPKPAAFNPNLPFIPASFAQVIQKAVTTTSTTPTNAANKSSQILVSQQTPPPRRFVFKPKIVPTSTASALKATPSPNPITIKPLGAKTITQPVPQAVMAKQQISSTADKDREIPLLGNVKLVVNKNFDPTQYNCITIKKISNQSGPIITMNNISQAVKRMHYAVSPNLVPWKRPMLYGENEHEYSQNRVPTLVQVDEIRGPLVVRAAEIEKDIRRGVTGWPFKRIIRAHIADPHALGQKPITFIRQVLACAADNSLIDDPNCSYPQDVRTRARELLSNCAGGSSGSYTSSAGNELIKRHVAEFIEKRDGCPASWEDIYLTSGASEAVRIILALINSSEDGLPTGVLVPIPQYPLYTATLSEYGMYAINYFLDEEHDWSINVADLERALFVHQGKCRPRAIVVINPGNPTGAVLKEENIREVIKFARSNGLFIIADEVYQQNIYTEDVEFHSFKKVLTNMNIKLELASLMSTSKGYASEAGVRGGYAEIVNLAPNIKAMLLKLLSVRICSSILGQVALDCVVRPPIEGNPSYDVHESEKKFVLDSLAERAKYVSEQLNTIPGIHCTEITGSLYAFPSIEMPLLAIKEAKSKGQQPDFLYAMQLLEEYGIVVIPGCGVGQKRNSYHFRTTILLGMEELKEMLFKLRRFHSGFLRHYTVHNEFVKKHTISRLPDKPSSKDTFSSVNIVTIPCEDDSTNEVNITADQIIAIGEAVAVPTEESTANETITVETDSASIAATKSAADTVNETGSVADPSAATSSSTSRDYSNIDREIAAAINSILGNDAGTSAGEESQQEQQLFIPEGIKYNIIANTVVKCPGCKEAKFSAHQTSAPGAIIYPKEYYEHCMLRCDKYKALNLIKKCVHCGVLCLNPKSYGSHRRKAHKLIDKPEWMTMKQFAKSKLVTYSNTTFTQPCPACGKLFKAIKYANTRAVTKEIAYYVHLVEECEDYKGLNRISQCEKCMCKFLTKRGKFSHVCTKS